MKRFFILVNCLFFIVFLLLSEIPEGYYDSAKGKTGYELKTTLYHIIKDHTDIGYKKLFDAYKTTDTKPGNIVWDMYSDIPGGTPPYIYYHKKKTCGNYKKESDCYNREHSLPQSWFKRKRPMKSDLFHVWTSSGKISLSDIEGSSVYIAFQYRSSGTGPGSSTLWKLDNVSVKGETETGH